MSIISENFLADTQLVVLLTSQVTLNLVKLIVLVKLHCVAVWMKNVLHRSMYLNTWSLIDGFICEGYGTIRKWRFSRERMSPGQAWGLTALTRFLCPLLTLTSCVRVRMIPARFLFLPMSFPCYCFAFLAMMKSVPLNYKPKQTSLSCFWSGFFFFFFYYSNRKPADTEWYPWGPCAILWVWVSTLRGKGSQCKFWSRRRFAC